MSYVFLFLCVSSKVLKRKEEVDKEWLEKWLSIYEPGLLL